jgi:RNA polymerase sigma-54 factor
MALTQGMQFKQSQNMVMTPQLQQSIKILQYTSLELNAHITQAVEQNPFLEDASPEAESLSATQEAEQAPALSENDTLIDRTGDKWADDNVSSAVYEDTDLAYTGVSNFKQNDYSASDPFENLSSKEISLRDHLIDQIYIDIHTPQERIIAFHLTDMLDESGYLIGSVQEVAEQLQCDVADVKSVLTQLQSFDPAGVFAGDLAECLALQLKDRNRYDPVIEKLLANLDLMAAGELTKLSRLCQTSEEEIKEMCLEIKTLNPKPGNVFATEAVSIQQPDVFLKKNTEGEWVVEVNTQVLPKVLVNQKYYAKLTKEVGKNKEDKKYLVDQINSANWLVKAMDQRAQTILKVSTEIVSQQKDFFSKGIRYLKPLVLTDIAAQVELHESTVSRVVNGKYMATPMGLYELKYFFSSVVGGNGGSGGEGHSSTSVKHMIKDLIDQEDPKKILSDEKIAKILKASGVDVARRTVMKYREAMNISSSVQRRKEKRMEIRE